MGSRPHIDVVFRDQRTLGMILPAIAAWFSQDQCSDVFELRGEGHEETLSVVTVDGDISAPVQYVGHGRRLP